MKQKLFARWNINREDTDAKERYTARRNKLTTIIKNTRNQFFKDKIMQNKSPKTLWKTVTALTGPKQLNSDVKVISNENNVVTSAKIQQMYSTDTLQT